MAKMYIDNVGISFVSELKQYGRTDDGQPYIGEQYVVVLTDPSGRKWYHNQRFDGVEVTPGDEWSDGETCFRDVRPWAVAKCKRLIRRVAARGWINTDYWSEGRPSYGSIAYQQGNWSEKDARAERLEDDRL